MTDQHIPGGPGWVVDSTTLRPRVVDPRTFEADRADDDLTPILLHLWGEDAQRAAESLAALPESYRRQVLLAEAWSRLGRHQESVQLLETLHAKTREPGRRIHLADQLGRALLAAGQPEGALAHFTRALQARIASGASADQVQVLRRGALLARERMAG
ncbi:hypothetical protein [Luteococcus sp. OSA5]|uniref:hypothetical protein n=1 Tax=Luteococcus sp. OSA5 TaxID=3401630 RepID=UPI003B435611